MGKGITGGGEPEAAGSIERSGSIEAGRDTGLRGAVTEINI
jgi:hypothetical protein